jgi:DNA-binding response OmpR family regulator
MTQAANILIVEDEAHLAQGLLFNLQAEGYRASIAGDGASALELLLDGAREGGDFDAVLLDVMLPDKADAYGTGPSRRRAARLHRRR